MRRRRVQLDEEVMGALIESPDMAFQIMKEAGIRMPKGAEYLFLRLNLERMTIDFRFHREAEDFVRDYATVVGKGRDEIEPMCYAMTGGSRGRQVWEPFMPPPVVGPLVKTRLRAGIIG